MSIVLDGTSGITTNSGTVVSTTDASISGLTVGKGGGAVSTNTAVGASALAGTNTGGLNTGLGYQALQTNTSGTSNTALGYLALNANTTANYNTAVGDRVLRVSTGAANTGVGGIALYSNTTGANNTSVGEESLFSNTTASNNTAVGYQAGYSGVTAPRNTSIGYKAGYANTTGYNCFIGTTSGVASTGYGNTFVGADYANGCGALVTSGNNNTILGGYSGNQGGLDIRTSSNFVVLSDGDGNPRIVVNNDGNVLIGATSANGSRMVVNGATGGTAVLAAVNSTGSGNQFGISSSLGSTANNTSSAHFQGGTTGAGNWYLLGNGTTTYTSDQRLKKNIETTRDGYLADICRLRVVKYNWKNDAEGTDKELGLIAQEVEQIFPKLVQDDLNKISPDDDILYKTLKGSVIPYMLLKAIQELKTIVDAQAAEIAELKAKVA
jgi:hypothetical protein